MNQEGSHKFFYGIIVIVVIALLVIGYGAIRSFIGAPADSEVATSTESLPEDEIRIVNSRHQFKGGVHTYVGEIVVPTPCDLLNFSVATSTAGAHITFTTKSSDDPCAQVITSQRFKVSYQGSATSTVSASLNGSPVRLNVIEVGETENLDEFEIYIKG